MDGLTDGTLLQKQQPYRRGNNMESPQISTSNEKTRFTEAELECTYKNQDLNFLVLSVHRNCLSNIAAEQARWPLRRTPLDSVVSSQILPTTDSQLMIYVPIITLMEESREFFIVYLNSKYDQWIAANKLRPGCIICIKEFIVHGQPVQNVKCNYIEIQDLELIPPNTTYEYEKIYLNHFLKNFHQEVLPVDGMVRLNTWFDMIPYWREESEFHLDDSLIECDSSYVKKNKDKLTNIATLSENLATDPARPDMLLVRVLRKTRLTFYIPKTGCKAFSTKSMFHIADASGTCAMVMWDNSNLPNLYTKIHVGSVLLIRDYKPKRNKFIRQYPNDRPQPDWFSIEVAINEPLPNKVPTQRENVNVTIVEEGEDIASFGLPDERYNFVQYVDQRLLAALIFVDISGIVTGISRYYRISRLNNNNIGTAFVFRFIEIYDFRNQRYQQIEFFINDQLESHKSLDIGDLVVLTFVRSVCRRSVIAEVELKYFSSTQETQMFLVKGGFEKFGIDPLIGPPTIIDEFKNLITKVEKSKLPRPMWIGGSNWLTWACLLGNHIAEIIDGNMNFKGNVLKSNLDALLLFEVKSFGFDGIVASVECCTMKQMKLNYIKSSLERIEYVTEEANFLYKIPDFDDTMKDVKFIGMRHPNIAMLPVWAFSKAATIIKEALEFPPSTVLDMLNRRRISRVIKAKNMAYKHFFRILLLDEDKRHAVWTTFIPPSLANPEQVPTTLIDLLKQRCELNASIGGFLARTDFAPTVEYLEILKKTGDGIKNRNFVFILQAYKHRHNLTEIAFNSAIDK